MAAPAATARSTVSPLTLLIPILELSFLAVAAIGAGSLGALALSGSALVPILPTITAIALVLIPGLLAHSIIRLISCDFAATTLLALAGTGIRLTVTLAGALLIAFTASWGKQLAFWVPLVASYLAVLAAELFFSIRRTPR